MWNKSTRYDIQEMFWALEGCLEGTEEDALTFYASPPPGARSRREAKAKAARRAYHRTGLTGVEARRASRRAWYARNAKPTGRRVGRPSKAA